MNLTSFYDFKWWQLSVVFAGIYLALAYITNNFVLTDSFYYSSFSTQLSSDRIDGIIHLTKRLNWISYVAMPVFLSLKWSIVAAIIYAGMFLFNQNITFKYCLKIITLAELVPIIVTLLKLAYFFIYPPSNLQDIQGFYPLSLTAFFSHNKLPSYLVYPLQQFNLFEAVYWLFIAAGIQSFTQNTFGYSLKIVASSYGIALCVWVLIVMFIQLQFGA